MRELRSHFRPEFLNRVDDFVLFKPLTIAEIKRIVELQIEHLKARLLEKDIHLELTDMAKTFVAKAAFDPVFGSRPLKRYFQHQLETRIGRALIAGEAVEGSSITVNSTNDALEVNIQPPKSK